MENLISNLNKQISSLSDELLKKFDDSTISSQLLTKKNISKLSSKVYNFTESKNDMKELLLRFYKNYLRNYLKCNFLMKIYNLSNLQDFAKEIVQQYSNFKKFTFVHFHLLLHAHDYFQSAFANYRNKEKPEQKEKSNIENLNECIYPLPVISIFMFRLMILDPFRNKINRIVLEAMKKQRDREYVGDHELRGTMEMMWDCSLGELARIKISQGTISFYQQNKPNLAKAFNKSFENDSYLSQFFFDSLVNETSITYSHIRTQISHLHPHQQLSHIVNVCEREQQIASYHLQTSYQRKKYLSSIYYQLIELEIDNILRRQKGFKQLFSAYRNEHSNEQQLIHYFCILKKVEETKCEELIECICEVIAENGALINKKINKHKQHIVQMLNFKKSITHIIALGKINSFNIEITVEKSFKKLMDTIEISRNLAEYTDFILRDCIKLKQSEQAWQQKFNDIFTLLSSLAARDSYLLYHQQLLAKRLINCLTQPRIDIQQSFLKRITEQLGSVMVTTHFNMLKDISQSIQMSEKYVGMSKVGGIKYQLKVYNGAVWPQSFTKSKLNITPPTILLSHINHLSDCFHQEFQLRYLSFKYEKGTSLFQGIFKNGIKYRFQSENIYMIILLHLNECQNFSILYGNLKQLIKDQKTEVQNQSSLLKNSVMVLVQSGLLVRKSGLKTEELQLSQQLGINRNYIHPNNKPSTIIPIRPSPQMLKKFHSNTIEHSKILKDRQKLIEAVLVKLLKHSHSTGNNTITFNELFKGIKDHHILGGFNFSESIVKLRLEELISKNYCERDEKDRKIYHYIA